MSFDVTLRIIVYFYSDYCTAPMSFVKWRLVKDDGGGGDDVISGVSRCQTLSTCVAERISRVQTTPQS